MYTCTLTGVLAAFPVPTLSQDDFIQGVVLSLIKDWGAWVHRRLARVTLADQVTSERHISRDFALAFACCDQALPSDTRRWQTRNQKR